ncbi:hypothetical protein BU26DRAFT_566352 [Trematosphaeria pertusa]|uniref:Uncharacterized protein n=1 Tax=Trematosphaeria pertusa TaxID=390896 RepID=A0A6A6IAU7_9PLEO|nr:uncharacterized protein BU26DRAFT_566352 [Trematosphaeria pertusa]KAF2247369.1 hypothetical protein BU26DRAFT_566352 [Trematosphaeria pertusa]
MELAYGDSMLYLRPVGLNRIRGIHLKRKSEAMQHSFTGIRGLVSVEAVAAVQTLQQKRFSTRD